MLAADRLPRRRAPTSTPSASSARVDGGADQLRDVVRLLDERGIEVDDVGLRRPTLDEVFLAVTGRPLEPTDPDTDPQTSRRTPPDPWSRHDHHHHHPHRTSPPARRRPHDRRRLRDRRAPDARGERVLQFFRTPQLLMMGTIQGALFLFMFRYIFGGAIDPAAGVDYVDFLVPGFLVTGDPVDGDAAAGRRRRGRRHRRARPAPLAADPARRR